MLAVALALVGGIVAGHYSGIGSTAYWVAGMATCALTLGVMLIVGREWYKIRTVALILALLFVLCGGGMMETHRLATDWTSRCGERAYFLLQIDESPQPRARSFRARAKVLEVDGQACGGHLTLYVGKDSCGASLGYGDRVAVYGKPDREWNSLYAPSGRYAVTARGGASVRYYGERLRLRLLHRMYQGPLPERYAAIAAALTLGWRADVPEEVRSEYRDAGVAHLLAVSGLHVGLLASMVGALLFWTGNERRGRMVRGGGIFVAIWLFALLTGMAPSTVRAALMFSLFVLANIWGRRTPRLNILATAAVLTLAVDTGLLFDVGWQLSYSAVAGILVMMPLIRAFHSRLWQAVAVSMAATIATTPVTVSAFGRFYPYFLIANVVVVPFAGLVLMLALLYVALPCGVVAWPLEMLLRGIELLTHWVSGLPYAVVEFTP